MRVISVKNLPTRLPIGWTAILALGLDRINPPGWVTGSAWTIMGILWIACIVVIAKQEHVDVVTGAPLYDKRQQKIEERTAEIEAQKLRARARQL